MQTILTTLQSSLGYTFQSDALLLQALTHRSKQKTKNNERLEFLGDSILSVVIAGALFSRFPKAPEGDLSCLRSALVRGETIAKIACELGIGECLQLGVGELRSGGHKRESILAGAFEAVIGAIYLDSDFECVRQCVLNWYANRIDKIEQVDVKDPKTTLQEWLQARQMSLPHYTCVVSGDAHAQTFRVICTVPGLSHQTEGKSTSRRKAEQIAAEAFLKLV